KTTSEETRKRNFVGRLFTATTRHRSTCTSFQPTTSDSAPSGPRSRIRLERGFDSNRDWGLFQEVSQTLFQKRSELVSDLGTVFGLRQNFDTHFRHQDRVFELRREG